jgi:hypothetical protein
MYCPSERVLLSRDLSKLEGLSLQSSEGIDLLFDLKKTIQEKIEKLPSDLTIDEYIRLLRGDHIVPDLVERLGCSVSGALEIISLK